MLDIFKIGVFVFQALMGFSLESTGPGVQTAMLSRANWCRIGLLVMIPDGREGPVIGTNGDVCNVLAYGDRYASPWRYDEIEVTGADFALLVKWPMGEKPPVPSTLRNKRKTTTAKGTFGLCKKTTLSLVDRTRSRKTAARTKCRLTSGDAQNNSPA